MSSPSLNKRLTKYQPDTLLCHLRLYRLIHLLVIGKTVTMEIV